MKNIIMIKKYNRDLLIDITLIICTTFLTMYFIRVGNFNITPNIFFVFIAGVFFTSAFTIAPAAIVLSHLADSIPLLCFTTAG